MKAIAATSTAPTARWLGARCRLASGPASAVRGISSTPASNNPSSNSNTKKPEVNLPKMFTKPQRLMMESNAAALESGALGATNKGAFCGSGSTGAAGSHTLTSAAAASISSSNPDDFSYSAQQRTMIDRIVHAPVATTESQIRKDLAVAHRLMARYGYDDLVWNHISARCGSIGQDDACCDISPDTFLITPGGLHFSEVTPEDLVFDSTEESGNVIHSGVYQHRPDVVSVIHAHTVPVMAVSALKDGFKFLTQDAAGFYGKIGYHDWEGLHDSESEKERVAENLGDKGIALILRNHGAVVVGRSIQEAWVRFYYLDRCCRVQLEAMRTGAELLECSPEYMLHAAEQKERFFPDGRYEWPALTRLVSGRPLHGRGQDW